MNQATPLKADPRRILVRGPNWLGDAVMSMPALQRLRERFPNAHMTLLTHEKLAGLWGFHHAINEVISFSAEDSIFAVGRRLREKAFDLALLFPNSPRSALEVWRAMIPTRVGYRRPWRNWLLTHPVAMRKGHVDMHRRSA